MGASGSTLDDGSGTHHQNNGDTGSVHDGQEAPINTSGNSSKGHSKHSLKRRQRAAQQSVQPQSSQEPVLTASDDGLHRLHGSSNNATPSPSTADLLAAPPSVTTTNNSYLSSAPSHFGNLVALIDSNGDGGAAAASKPSSSNTTFLGRYTPFPPPPTQMLTPSAQLAPTHPLSFSSASSSTANKTLLADPRDHGSGNKNSTNGSALGVDVNTLVVLQDYEISDVSRNQQISLRQGDALHLIAERGTRLEVCLPDSVPEASGSFLVPHNVVKKCPSLEAFPWYHGQVSRAEAERLLSSGIDGTFLVRESESSPGQLSVSLRSGQRVHHYRLTIDTGLWFLSPEWRFRTVPHLVRHHSRHPDGLACSLLYPAPRISTRCQTPPLSSVTTQVGSSGECWELDRTDLRVLRRLGGGQYGEVYEAIWLSRNAKVAVKTLRLDCAMGEREFLQEARVMTALRHPNLVKLLGVVSRERPFYIVTEFMSHGNLQDFLRVRQSRPDITCQLPIISVLLRFALDVASAMKYLESRHFIHRDLAARNCLVTEELEAGESGFTATGIADKLVVKVGDFGLARLVGGNSGKGATTDAAYTANAAGQFPIKWTAPEGLAYQRFSTKSDVWAFGILLWEIVTYGASPYPSVELSGVYALLERGYRMEQPNNCPSDIYQIMRECWLWEPLERPSFSELESRLSSFLKTQSIDSNSNKISTDAFYEQLSTTTAPFSSVKQSGNKVMETSTFGQPFIFNESERTRSESLSSPSPSKNTTANGNGKIARCRPNNFSFRPSTSPSKQPPAATTEDTLQRDQQQQQKHQNQKAESPPLLQVPRVNCSSNDAIASDQGSNSVSGGGGGSGGNGGLSLRRGSGDNKQQKKSQKNATTTNGSSRIHHGSGSNLAVASSNLHPVVTTGRGYGSLATPGVPPKPAVDFTGRVTAELAEQMRKRRALAEQEPEKQPSVSVLASNNASYDNNNNNNNSSSNSQVSAAATGATGKNSNVQPSNITLQRHSTDPIAPKPALSGSSSGSRQPQHQHPGASEATSTASAAPLVSGDGRPVAPVKPCLRRFQGQYQQNQQQQQQENDYSATTSITLPSSNRPSPAVVLRSASPSLAARSVGNSSNNNSNNSTEHDSNNVNWTWDDVHRLCQGVISTLAEESSQQSTSSAMTVSTMGRLPTPAPSPVTGLLTDLATALDSLADSLPPISRFQVRQLVHAIRSGSHSTSTIPPNSIVSSAQINNVLNLIPPPSLLTTSSSSISTSSSINNNNNNNNNNSNSVSSSGNLHHDNDGDTPSSSSLVNSSISSASNNSGTIGKMQNSRNENSNNANSPPTALSTGLLC